ncbi:hypothetical protein HDU76_010505 [Blyttiomyces sp. JEL0837]|nr:hypothetical protein HDU76_010505 [Blyttiomyces sp. JEL0837]
MSTRSRTTRGRKAHEEPAPETTAAAPPSSASLKSNASSEKENATTQSDEVNSIKSCKYKDFERHRTTLESIAKRVCKNYGWQEFHAVDLARELFRGLCCKAMVVPNDLNLSLPPRLDMVWHAFILETREYIAFCDDICHGTYLHHTATTATDPVSVKNQRVATTQLIYQTLFRKYPSGEWCWELEKPIEKMANNPMEKEKVFVYPMEKEKVTSYPMENEKVLDEDDSFDTQNKGQKQQYKKRPVDEPPVGNNTNINYDHQQNKRPRVVPQKAPEASVDNSTTSNATQQTHVNVKVVKYETGYEPVEISFRARLQTTADALLRAFRSKWDPYNEKAPGSLYFNSSRLQPWETLEQLECEDGDCIEFVQSVAGF